MKKLFKEAELELALLSVSGDILADSLEVDPGDLGDIPEEEE